MMHRQPAMDFSNSERGDLSARSRSSSASTLSEFVINNSNTMSSPGYFTTTTVLADIHVQGYTYSHASASRQPQTRPALANLISTLANSLPSASSSNRSVARQPNNDNNTRGEMLFNTSASSSTLSSPVSSMPPATPTSNNVSPYPSPSALPFQMQRTVSNPLVWQLKATGFGSIHHAHSDGDISRSNHNNKSSDTSDDRSVTPPGHNAIDKRQEDNSLSLFLSPPPPNKRSRSNTIAGLPSAIVHASEKLAAATGLGLTFGTSSSQSNTTSNTRDPSSSSASYIPRRGTVPLPLPLRQVASFARLTGLTNMSGKSQQQQHHQQHHQQSVMSRSVSQPQSPKSPRSLLGQLAFVPPRDDIEDDGKNTPFADGRYHLQGKYVQSHQNQHQHQHRQHMTHGHHYRRGSLTGGILPSSSTHFSFSDLLTPGPWTTSSTSSAITSPGTSPFHHFPTTSSGLSPIPPYTPLTAHHTAYIEHVSVSYNPSSDSGKECKKLLMRLERFKKRASLDISSLVNSNFYNLNSNNSAFTSPPTTSDGTGNGSNVPGTMSRNSSNSTGNSDSTSSSNSDSTPNTPVVSGSQSFKVMAKIWNVPDQNKIEVLYIDGFKLVLDAKGLSHTQLLGKQQSAFFLDF